MFIYNDLMDSTFTIVAGSIATDSKVIILVLVFRLITDSKKNLHCVLCCKKSIKMALINYYELRTSFAKKSK